MKYNAGFSLIIFMIYLLLFSLIVVLTTSIISTLFIPSLASVHKCNFLIELHIAQDLFVGDVRKIESAKSLKSINSHELTWCNEKTDICWRFNNNRLERVEENRTDVKSKKNTSIVASGISEATFTIEKSNMNTSVELLLTPKYDQSLVVRSYCTLRTGLTS